MNYKQKQNNIKSRLKVAKKGVLIWIATDIYRSRGQFRIPGDTFRNIPEHRQVMIDRGARSVTL